MFVVYNFIKGGCRGSYSMVVGFTVQSVPITIKVVGSNPVHGKVYTIQHYWIKFDGGFLQQ